MKTFLKLFLITTFFASLAMGEELCCGELFESENSHSEMSHEADVTTLHLESTDLHFCDNSSETPESSHHKNHSCVGCSHAPFAQLNKTETKDIFAKNEPLYFEKTLFITQPFLDGPFQPPRA